MYVCFSAKSAVLWNTYFIKATLELAPTAQAAAEGQRTLTNVAATQTTTLGASPTSNLNGNGAPNSATISRTSIAYLVAPLLVFLF